MNESRLRFRIGIFVFVACFILVGGLLFFGNKNIWEKNYDLPVHFRFTNGVKVGAPVRYSGVNIGKVKQVNILNNRIVEVILKIDDSVKLHQNIDIYIKSLGVIGETYVDIVGGSVDSPLVPKNASVTLEGKDPMNMNDFIFNFQYMAFEITHFFKNMNSVFGQKDLKENIFSTFQKFPVVLENSDKVLDHCNKIFLENRTHIQHILSQGSQSFDSILESLQIVEGLLSDVAKGKGLVGKLFHDEDLYKEIQYFIADLSKNPWKLLYKGRSRSKKNKNIDKKNNFSFNSGAMTFLPSQKKH